MEEMVSSQNEKVGSPYFNSPTAKIGLLIFGLTVLGVTFYGGIFLGKSFNSSPSNSPAPQTNINSQASPQPTKQIVKTPTPTGYYIDKKLRIYPSLNGHYSFYTYPSGSEGKCLYGIIDKEGYEHDISKALGTDQIQCSEGMGNLLSSIIGWSESDQLLINEPKGEVKIINIDKFEAETYKYDAGKYFFIGANRSLKYWLFRKVSQGKSVSYVLFDRNNNIALDNINFDSNDRGAIYDEVNDGFLFISRTYTGENVSVKFDFLPMNNLSLRNILTTEPVVAPGRGCSSEYLISQPREIVLTPGCLTVGKKYLGPDGNIHIKI